MTKEDLKVLRGNVNGAMDLRCVREVLAGILNHLISEAEKPKERWRAVEGKPYWYVSNDGRTETTLECPFENDENRFAIGNYYRTEAEAKAAAERVRKAYVVE